MNNYKEGFDKPRFEADHFVFRLGSREKLFNGWEDVRYEGGLTPYQVNKNELEDGNMHPQLYDFLCHVYGEDGMAKYFPMPEAEQRRKATLHFSPTSVMANGVKTAAGSPKDQAKPMSDEEIDELAALLCGGRRWNGQI